MNVDTYQRAKAVFENGLGPKARKGLLVAGGITFLALSPAIIAAAAHGFVAAGMLGVGYFLTRPKTLRSIDYGVMMLSEKLADSLIKGNPLGMIAADIRRGEEKIARSERGTDALAERIRQIRQGSADAASRSQEALRMARGAKGMTGSVATREWRTQSRRAYRLNQSQLTLKDMADRLELYLRFFLRMQEISREKLDDLKTEQEALAFEVQADDAVALAQKDLRALMGQKYEIFERSAKAIKARSAALLGDMDMDLLRGQDLIARSDIEQGMIDTEVVRLMQQLESGEVQTNLLKEGDLAKLTTGGASPFLELERMPGDVAARSRIGDTDKRYSLLEVGSPTKK